MRHPLRTGSVPIDRDGHDGRAGLEREAADAAARAAERAGADARALGEDQDGVAAGEDRLGGLDHVLVAGAARATGKAPSAVEEPAEKRLENSSCLAT